MATSGLLLEERLSILRSEDRFRDWESLDDQRFCIFCDKTFTGRQVEIKRVGHGKWALHCPTQNCKSTPRHWVYPGNPLVSRKAYKDWSLALGTPEKTAVPRRGGATLRLRHA